MCSLSNDTGLFVKQNGKFTVMVIGMPFARRENCWWQAPNARVNNFICTFHALVGHDLNELLSTGAVHSCVIPCTMTNKTHLLSPEKS